MNAVYSTSIEPHTRAHTHPCYLLLLLLLCRTFVHGALWAYWKIGASQAGRGRESLDPNPPFELSVPLLPPPPAEAASFVESPHPTMHLSQPNEYSSLSFLSLSPSLSLTPKSSDWRARGLPHLKCRTFLLMHSLFFKRTGGGGLSLKGFSGPVSSDFCFL